MTSMNTFGLIGLTEENVGIDRRFYTGLTSTNGTFAVSYNAGRVDVFLNGIKLVGNHTGNTNYDYTMDATTGTGSSITLATGVALVSADVVECIGYVSNSSNTITSYNPTPASGDGGWNVFINITHTASDLVNVFLNGVLLDDSDYTLDASNNKVTIGGATLTASDVVVIQVIGALDHSNFVPAGGGTFTGNVGVTGNLTVDTDTLKVDSSTNRIGITNASPGEALHIKTTADADYGIKVENDDTQAFCKVQSGGTALYGGNAGVNIISGGSFANSMQIASGGDVTVNRGNLVIGTAGKGIDFSAQTTSSASGTTPNTSAGAEVLDHYEEGTWTIDVQGSTTAGTDTIGGQLSNYTRIGRQVNVNVWFNLTNLTGYSGGTLKFAGLPFQSKASCDAVGTCMIQNHDFTYDAKQLTLYIGSSYNYFLVYVSRDDAGWLQINDDTAFDMIASLTYYTT